MITGINYNSTTNDIDLKLPLNTADPQYTILFFTKSLVTNPLELPLVDSTADALYGGGLIFLINQKWNPLMPIYIKNYVYNAMVATNNHIAELQSNSAYANTELATITEISSIETELKVNTLEITINLTLSNGSTQSITIGG